VGLARQPNARERRVLNLKGIRRRLESEKAKLATSLVRLRTAHARSLADTLAKKDARDTAAFTDLRAKHLPGPDASAIKSAIRAMQSRVAEFGAGEVRRELRRQGAVVRHLGGQRATANKRTLTSALVSSAEATSDRLVQSWHSLALDNAVRLRRSGLVGQALADALVDALTEVAEQAIKRAAGEEVNEAFALGRHWQADQAKDSIELAVYSCVMDDRSCDTCEELDGEEFEVGSDEYESNAPPNKNCDGKDNCRCVYLFLVKGE
jgi:SPP1 gp7 family putative phage head morphogenesis protein